MPSPDSPCAGCPLRDIDFGPMFGIGNRRNPSVIVVAESPNDPGTSTLHGDQRPGNKGGVRADLTNYWRNAETSTEASWRNMAKRFSQMLEGIVPCGREGAYLTNVWRCPNNKQRRALRSKQIQEGRERCLHYLTEELTVAGSVPILTLGQEALDGVLDALGDVELTREVRLHPFAKHAAVQGVFYSRKNGAYVIPAFHWSRGPALVALHSRRASEGYLGGIRDRLSQVLRQETLHLSH